MARWSKKLSNSVNFAVEKVPEESFLENWFENRLFIPQNEEEQKEFEDFSFVSNAMALAVYTALSDGEISADEEKQIIEEMMIQIIQHHYEYEDLSEDFGQSDKNIISSLYQIYLKEITLGTYSIDETIRLINMIYENNPYKKYYLLRLCYLVAYTDSRDTVQQLTKVNELAAKLQVSPEEQERIRNEVKLKLE